MLWHFGIKAGLDCQIESAGIGVPSFSAQPLKPRFNPKITSAWMKFYHLESLKIFFFFLISTEAYKCHLAKSTLHEKLCLHGKADDLLNWIKKPYDVIMETWHLESWLDKIIYLNITTSIIC